jgi:hypothetical protein
MSNTAGAWVLYRLTHSALALGLQGLCFSAPIAVLPLLTGILADRFSRLTLVKATLAAEAAQSFALAAIAGAGDLRPWMLYLAAAADACRLAVNIPAQSALVPNIVPAEMLLSAMALSTSTWSSAALVGPALAGALLTVTGPGLIFAINGACTLVALGARPALRSPSPSSSWPARPCAWPRPRSSPAPWSSRPFPMRCGAGSARWDQPGRTGWPVSPPPPPPQ